MISTYIFHDHIFEDNPVPKGVPLSDGDKPVPGEKNLHLIGLNLYMTEHSLYLMVLSPVPAGAEPVYLMLLSLYLLVLSLCTCWR